MTSLTKNRNPNPKNFFFIARAKICWVFDGLNSSTNSKNIWKFWNQTMTCILHVKIRTETGKKSIVGWGPKIWQEIPPDMQSKHFLLFKKKYANHLISNYINTWCLQSMDVEWCYPATVAWTLSANVSYPLFQRSCVFALCSGWSCSSFWYHKHD